MTRISPTRHQPPVPAETPAPAKGAQRKAPLRRVSAKRQKLMRVVGPKRKAYIQEIGYCEVCWTMDRLFTNENLVVHEIVKGPGREKALEHRAAQLVACNGCNTGRLEDYSVCPIEKQLAIKLLSDPEHFDLELVNQLRMRARTAIELRDVLHYLVLRK